MNKIQQVFKQPKVLLPVIHVTTEEQALRNTEIVRMAGCKGAFFINHSIKHSKLFNIVEKCFSEFPMWIGVNTLDLTALSSIKKSPLVVTGVWADLAYIEDAINPDDGQLHIPALNLLCASEVMKTVELRGNTLYFGGVAFKHQKPVQDLKLVTTTAKEYMDVVTTSGESTGIAANVGKIEKMKEYLGTHPLGIASGITCENVHEYLPYVDVFLVATGISKSFTELDSDKVKELREKIEV